MGGEEGDRDGRVDGERHWLVEGGVELEVDLLAGDRGGVQVVGLGGRGIVDLGHVEMLLEDVCAVVEAVDARGGDDAGELVEAVGCTVEITLEITVPHPTSTFSFHPALSALSARLTRHFHHRITSLLKTPSKRSRCGAGLQ